MATGPRLRRRARCVRLPDAGGLDGDAGDVRGDKHQGDQPAAQPPAAARQVGRQPQHGAQRAVEGGLDEIGRLVEGKGRTRTG